MTTFQMNRRSRLRNSLESSSNLAGTKTKAQTSHRPHVESLGVSGSVIYHVLHRFLARRLHMRVKVTNSHLHPALSAILCTVLIWSPGQEQGSVFGRPWRVYKEDFTVQWMMMYYKFAPINITQQVKLVAHLHIPHSTPTIMYYRINGQSGIIILYPAL